VGRAVLSVLVPHSALRAPRSLLLAALFLIAAPLLAAAPAAPAPAAPAAPAPADWLTNRGNPQRTGSADDKPGPASPKVLWLYKAPEQYIASPVAWGPSLYVSALGPFGMGVFHSLALDPQAKDRAGWSKMAPFLKRPVVSAPAVVDGLLVFGDGMHQTDSATLYCMTADKGLPIWQLPLPGKLIHLEGSPTVDKGRVFIGGGDAGVLGVDLKRTVLGGKEMDLAAARDVVEKTWAALVAKYEKDKEADPTFAIPPSEDALPKPAPKLLWQKGQSVWHVDAPVAVVQDRVLVCSAYIDEEKVGKRLIACLNAADGATMWEAPLKVNPWAGPTVADGIVLVGCSSIRFDKQLIEGAKGEVVALDLASGQVKWRKAVPGGVLSPVAVKGDLAVFTATDGKVRGWNVATGQEKWVYAAANPFFAGPALSGGFAYVADLKANVAALALSDGKAQWALDVPNDPACLMPGQVFGSPLLNNGHIYISTCNLEANLAAQPNYVVCLGDKSESVVEAHGPSITVDKDRKTVTVPCKVALRKLPTLTQIYPLEVVACYPAPQGQKAHETVVTFDVKPSEVAKALESFGLKPGKPAVGEEGTPSGPEVRIYLELPGVGDKPRLLPLEKTMVDKRTGKLVARLKWYFTGSVMRQPDPNKPLKVYGADLGGTLIALFPVTDETVIQTNLTMKDSTLLRMETNSNVVPPEGTPLKLIIAVE
jgi:outer membrane protein assembly factor BamB